MIPRVLVAGFSTRHVAQSACNAGFRVCAVDHFCDLDLGWYCEDTLAFDDLAMLPDAIAEMAGKYRFDGLVVTSGAEDLPAPVPRIGSPPEQVARYLDKLATQEFLEGAGIPVPPLLSPGEYPAMIKPRRGAGGWRNAVVRDEEELSRWTFQYPDTPYLAQQVVTGIPSSVCCITAGGRARAIAVNRQVLRGAGISAFGFAGSVTPFVHPSAPLLARYAEQAAAASGCCGTVGIDFMAREDSVHAIELNPRFQGTLDTVESATGVNLFSLHAAACSSGAVPGKMPEPICFAARGVLFAERDLTIQADLRRFSPAVADIPRPGTTLLEGQAVVSVFGRGGTEDEALGSLEKTLHAVRSYLS